MRMWAHHWNESDVENIYNRDADTGYTVSSARNAASPVRNIDVKNGGTYFYIRVISK